MTANFCPNCGQDLQNAPSDKYCPECGNEIATSSSSSPDSDAWPENKATQEDKKMLEEVAARDDDLGALAEHMMKEVEFEGEP